ncbi:MAG: DNA polymerase III subunit gamma/tau [Acidobacteriota bacterium]|nr:DNA polymerase III subunit gamma/tau [Acidobacteriota bacterium]
MSYQVIARKWRPQTFEEVTGQEPITRTLRSAIEHDRLHHAYLFSGARGVGKTTTARLLAKALNCHRADRPTPTPCAITDPQACASCREVAEGRSIDVMEIDAASNTGVDNVREAIINNVAVHPARDRYKVFIIDEVHMLSGAAFNALLKTLEEPPPRVAFIMATTEAHKLPDTILSRCQQFEFRTIATAKIAERLRLIASAEQIEVSDDALREIARAGEGSMRDAQSAFDQVISFSGGAIEVDDVEVALGLAGAELRMRVTRAIADGSTAEVLAVVDSLETRGHDLRNFCRDLLAHLRHLLVVKVAGEAVGLADATESERREMKDAAATFSESDLVRFFHSVTETEKHLRESAHPRYQLEIGLVKLIEMRRLAPLGQIIDRLAALEESMRTGKAPPAASNTGSSAPPAVGSSSKGGSASSRPGNNSPTGDAASAASKAGASAARKIDGGSISATTGGGRVPHADEVPFPLSSNLTPPIPSAKPEAPMVAPRRTASSQLSSPASSSLTSSPSSPLLPSQLSSSSSTSSSTPLPASLKLVPPAAIETAPTPQAPSFFDQPPAPPEDYFGRRIPASAAGATTAAATAASPAFINDTVVPAPSTSGGDASATGDEIERIKSALDDRRRPLLGAALDSARTARIDGDDLYVVYTPDHKHLRDSLLKPDNAKILREVCREAVGRDLGLRVVVKTAGESDDVPFTKEDNSRREKAELRALVEKHPMVQEMLRTFRAEIIDVGRVAPDALAEMEKPADKSGS